MARFDGLQPDEQAVQTIIANIGEVLTPWECVKLDLIERLSARLQAAVLGIAVAAGRRRRADPQGELNVREAVARCSAMKAMGRMAERMNKIVSE